MDAAAAARRNAVNWAWQRRDSRRQQTIRRNSVRENRDRWATKVAIEVRTSETLRKKMIARDNYSIVARGKCGRAASIVMVSSNVLQLISSYLIMRDLHLFRQCCHASCKAVTLYVRAPADHGGMAARFWEKLLSEPVTRPYVGPIQQFQLDVAAAGQQSYVTGSSVMNVLSGDAWKPNDIDIVCTGNVDTLTAMRQLLDTLGCGPNKRIHVITVHNSLHADRTSIDHVHGNAFPHTISNYVSSDHLTALPESLDMYDNHGSPSWTTSLWNRYHCRPRSPEWTRKNFQRFIHDTDDDDKTGASAVSRVNDEVLPSWPIPDADQLASSTSVLKQPIPGAHEFHLQAGHILAGLPLVEGRPNQRAIDDYAKHSRTLYYNINLYNPCTCPTSQGCVCVPTLRMDILFVPANDCIMAGGLFGWMDRNCDIDLTVNGISPAGLRCYAPHYFESRSMFYRTDTYCLIPDPKTMQLIPNPVRPSCVGKRQRIFCNCERIYGRVTKYRERGFNVYWLSYNEYQRRERQASNSIRAAYQRQAKELRRLRADDSLRSLPMNLATSTFTTTGGWTTTPANLTITAMTTTNATLHRTATWAMKKKSVARAPPVPLQIPSPPSSPRHATTAPTATQSTVASSSSNDSNARAMKRARSNSPPSSSSSSSPSPPLSKTPAPLP